MSAGYVDYYFSSPDSPPLGKRRGHKTAHLSSVVLGDDSSFLHVTTPCVSETTAAYNSIVDGKMMSSSRPAGSPTGAPRAVGTRRHTYLGGSAVAALFDHDVPSSDTPQRTMTRGAAPERGSLGNGRATSFYDGHGTPPSQKKSSNASPNPVGQVDSPPTNTPPAGGRTLTSQRSYSGIVPVPEESKRATKRLMPDHPGGFKSNNIFGVAATVTPPLSPKRVPPALQSNIVLGAGDAPSRIPSMPRRPANESHVVLGDDGGDSMRGLRKKQSFRRYVTPPGGPGASSLADFIGAPVAAKTNKPDKPKVDPAAVSTVAGKSTGKHRVY